MKDLTQTRYVVDDIRRDVVALYESQRAAIDAFHRLWYGAHFTHGMTSFEGVALIKCPMDLWVYQEIIYDLKPTLIIETGTAFGGSALFFARQLDKLGDGAVISVDISPADTAPRHSRITYLRGSSIDPAIVERVRTRAMHHQRVMVVLDSDYGADHVSAELDAYASLVTPGQFLVVEDTNINGHPVEIDWKGGPGPHAAVAAFLSKYPDFARDPLAERYLLTMHPHGWLRRVR